jgi:hypothetical protein
MRVTLILVVVLAAACGGGPAPSRSPSATANATATAAGSASPTDPGATGDATSAEALCGLLTAADWQQFGYVTGAQPDVESDEPGTAVCTFANGLFLEVYTHAQPADAAETFDTIVENAPFDEPVDLPMSGTEDVIFDADIGDDNAGILVRSGNLVYTISGLARDSAQAELLALAGLVIQRGAHLI